MGGLGRVSGGGLLLGGLARDTSGGWPGCLAGAGLGGSLAFSGGCFPGSMFLLAAGLTPTRGRPPG